MTTSSISPSIQQLLTLVNAGGNVTEQQDLDLTTLAENETSGTPLTVFGVSPPLTSNGVVIQQSGWTFGSTQLDFNTNSTSAGDALSASLMASGEYNSAQANAIVSALRTAGQSFNNSAALDTLISSTLVANGATLTDISGTVISVNELNLNLLTSDAESATAQIALASTISDENVVSSFVSSLGSTKDPLTGNTFQSELTPGNTDFDEEAYLALVDADNQSPLSAYSIGNAAAGTLANYLVNQSTTFTGGTGSTYSVTINYDQDVSIAANIIGAIRSTYYASQLSISNYNRLVTVLTIAGDSNAADDVLAYQADVASYSIVAQSVSVFEAQLSDASDSNDFAQLSGFEGLSAPTWSTSTDPNSGVTLTSVTNSYSVQDQIAANAANVSQSPFISLVISNNYYPNSSSLYSSTEIFSTSSGAKTTIINYNPSPTANSFSGLTLESAVLSGGSSLVGYAGIFPSGTNDEVTSETIQTDDNNAILSQSFQLTNSETGNSDGKFTVSYGLTGPTYSWTPTNAADPPIVGDLNGGVLSVAAVANLFGSILSRELPISNLFLKEEAGSAIGVFSDDLENVLSAWAKATGGPLDLITAISQAMKLLPTEIAEAGAGAAATYLLGAALQAAGITGVPAGLLNATAGTLLGQIGRNIATQLEAQNPDIADNIFDGIMVQTHNVHQTIAATR